LQSFQAALERFRQNEDRSGETETLLNLALFTILWVSLSKLLSPNQQALSVGQAIGTPSLEALHCLVLAMFMLPSISSASH
jgi:hypothetical protein